MKAKFWWVAAALAVGFGATSTLAAEQGLYLAGNLGLFQHMDKETSIYDPWYDEIYDIDLSFKPGLFLSGAVGVDFGNGARGELEIGGASANADEVTASDQYGNSASVDASDVEISATIITLGGYYDFTTAGKVAPYVGGGLGFAMWEADDGYETVEETDLAGFGEVGLGIALNETVTFAPSYRLLWINNGSSYVNDSTAHVFKIGARFAL
ncbi:outer membrane beta-barrel protein [Rhodospirillaceae bacterium SYSU D60014]|uniref:outer membrane beta-barrel protein n=1 Tax=Virgifigura deserti TaxID=2268457 RepID=UPI000E663B3E